MITNESRRLRLCDLSGEKSLGSAIDSILGIESLRWYLSHVDGVDLVVQSTHLNEGYGERQGRALCTAAVNTTSVAVNVIPTGVGCQIGGYAGDAAPVTQLLSLAVDHLITNPNAVNASNFINISKNTLYVDGFALDLFCKGLTHLHIPRQNRIGVILDCSSSEAIDRAYNIVNSVRAVHGIDVSGIAVTDEPIGGRCVRNDAGAYTGTVDNLDAVYKSCDRLIAEGASAIAVASDIMDLPKSSYTNHFGGVEPNPVGGVEAVISYAIRRRYGVPVAHAPLTNFRDFGALGVVDARAAGEYASQSGLACVLVGLNRSPHLCGTGMQDSCVIGRKSVVAAIHPFGCLGGIPALFLYAAGIPLLAVRQNGSILHVNKESLGLDSVIETETYAEAAGLLLALRGGIAVESIRRPLRTFRPKVGHFESRLVTGYGQQDHSAVGSNMGPGYRSDETVVALEIQNTV